MFRNPRSLLFVFFFACLAALLVFSGDPHTRGANDLARDSLGCCQRSPFARQGAGSHEAAVRVCSCILSWHRKEGEATGRPLPAALYGGEGGAGAAAMAVDERARASCLSGRVTP
ncbi:hypothetical protein GAY28_11760 [Azospirillum brasilense]|nr:hypothetical protein [Azospirillum brasilense]